jgi:ribonuclease BN (tRNA processing enzyme)
MNKFFKKSKLKFVSTGGMFDYQLGNSSAIVQLGEEKILIDCGYTVFKDLSQKKLLDDIDYLLLTHLHGDHAGSLHPAILHWANKRKTKIKIIYPTEGFKSVLESYLNMFLVTVDKYVDFLPISDFKNIGYLDTLNLHTESIQSFAYYFNFEDQFIYFSGDLGDLNFSHKFLKNVNHDNVLVFHEVGFLEGSAHVHYKELEKLSDEFNVLAYHCNSKNAPSDCNLKFANNYPELLL